jgi:hypothetical protein
MSSITNFKPMRGKVGEVATEKIFLANDERLYLNPKFNLKLELELDLALESNHDNAETGYYYCSIS